MTLENLILHTGMELMTLEIMTGPVDFFVMWTHRMTTVTWICYKIVALMWCVYWLSLMECGLKLLHESRIQPSRHTVCRLFGNSVQSALCPVLDDWRNHKQINRLDGRAEAGWQRHELQEQQCTVEVRGGWGGGRAVHHYAGNNQMLLQLFFN